MSATRDQILRTLKTHGQATIVGLAEALSLSTVSVRHHLATLQAEGLVTSVEVRQGVGRPRLTYSLTPTAQERFPTKYVALSERLLDELKMALNPQQVEALFARMAEGMVADFSARLEGKPLEQKLELLVELLGTEGFLAKWRRTGETFWLTEYSCPYLHVGQRHPEVCSIDRAMISRALGADVEKTTCVLNGAENCEFIITPARPVPAAS
jgi:predicted ArsR family transcriptional regulator